MKSVKNNLLGIYEKGIPLSLSWDDKFKLAKESGFDFIELSIDGKEPRINRLYWTDEDIDEIYKISLKYKMLFKTLAFSAPRFYPLGDEELCVKGVAMVKRGIEIASKLHASIIQLPAYDVYNKPSTSKSQELYKKNIESLIPFAKRHNVIIGLEELEDVEHFNTHRKMADYLRSVNSPNLMLYGDTGNIAYNNLDLLNDLPYSKDHLVSCHIKDAVYHNEHNVKYGEGTVDFKGVFDYFREAEYQGYFVSEVWCEEDPDFVPYLKEISCFIRKYMED